MRGLLLFITAVLLLNQSRCHAETSPARAVEPLDLASDTAWMVAIEDESPRSIKVPADGFNSDRQNPPLIKMSTERGQRDVKDGKVVFRDDQVRLIVEPDTSEATLTDLIVVAGQSNAVGFDTKPDELAPDEVDARIHFWWRCGDPPPDEHDSTCGGKWTHLQAQPLGNPLHAGDRQYGNFRFPEGGFGPEISMGRTLYHKEGKPLAIIKAAWSGTSVRSDWNATGEAGACYRGLVSELKNALAMAKAAGIHLRPRAFVWVQGESDANPADAPHYAEALEVMLASLRKELNTPELPAFLGLNTRFGANPGGPTTHEITEAVKAQQSVAAKDPHCIYVNTEGSAIANGAHFSTEGTLEAGRRYAEAILNYEQSHQTNK